MNTLKQLQEDLDNITTLAFEAGKAEAIAMVLKEIGEKCKTGERLRDNFQEILLDHLKTKLQAKE